MKQNITILILFVGLLLVHSNKAYSQEPYLGDIKMTAVNFTQRGWAECNGQLLPISQNSALFSLLGTTYGGDGRTTFALPDLRGRVPIQVGQGPGLSPYNQGMTGGVETVTLSQNQMPAHTHGISVNTELGSSSAADTTYMANSGNLDKEYATTTDKTNTTMVQTTGNGSAIENRQPYLVVRYVICIQGLFPSRY